MNEVTAKLNNYRQSPRKVRLVASLISGKTVSDAKNRLNFATKRAVSPLHKLLNSAIANAKSLGFDEKDLKIKKITVDGGKILYRRMPVAHGAAHPIRKRTSHVTIILGASKKAQVEKPKSKKK